jgi:pimeloyl-ACP methyl ester carboxylesterase
VASSKSSAIADSGRAAGIAYERVGSGPPLLLIHGLGGTRGIWRPQIGRLAGEREVIAVDMPGFGESPPLPGRASPWGMAEALTRLCAELGLERPHIAGNSLGAWVALEMAKRGAAESLCLISPAGLWRRPLGPRRRDIRRWARWLRPLIVAALRFRRPREAMLRTTVGRPENLSAADASEVVLGWVDAPGYEAANDEMRAHVAEGLEEIDVRTTIAWGELDRLVAPPRPERRPPGSSFLVLPGCGHTPNWDEPELVSRLLLEASAS